MTLPHARLDSATSRVVRRVALTGAAWVTYGLVQVALSLLAARTTHLDRMSVVYTSSMAIGWTLFSLAIAAFARAVDGRRAGAWSRAGAHAGGMIVIFLADAAWRRATLIGLHIELTIPFYATALYYADLNTAAYLAVLAVSRALDLEDLMVVQTRRQLVLRAQLAQARFDYLEAQLQPHFLFNSLGTVAELAHEAPAAAARMLRQLASLLRFAVHEHGHAVTLRDELDALEPYLDIQRMRFSDWLTIEHDVTSDALTSLVPRLTLQPLVENAIRHGLAGRTERGLIRISGSRRGDRLRLAVQDDGVGLKAAAGTEGYGIGLMNMRRRLAAAYGDDFVMTLSAAGGGGTVATIDLPTTFNPTIVGHEPVPAAEVRTPGRVFDLYRQHPVLTGAAAWCIWGVLWFQMSYAYLAIRHRLAEVTFGPMIVEHAVAVGLWAVLTPVILRLARALPLTAPPRRLVLHIPLACACALLHVALWQLLAAEHDALWSPRYVASMLWTVLLYVFLVAVSQYRQVIEWFRERETATARLEAELAEARVTAAAVRFKPDAVLTALEELAAGIHLDSGRAESNIARLADDLRLVLE